MLTPFHFILTLRQRFTSGVAARQPFVIIRSMRWYNLIEWFSILNFISVACFIHVLKKIQSEREKGCGTGSVPSFICLFKYFPICICRCDAEHQQQQQQKMCYNWSNKLNPNDKWAICQHQIDWIKWIDMGCSVSLLQIERSWRKPIKTTHQMKWNKKFHYDVNISPCIGVHVNLLTH